MALQQFNLKLLPETIQQWKDAQANSEAETGNEFVELLLEKFLNPKVKNIEVIKLPADFEQQIQNFQNEIGRLKTEISLKDDHISELETRNSELATRNPEPVTLTENQVLLNLSPKVLEVAKIEAAAAEKITKKPFSLEDVFKQNFWAAIKEGRAYPWRVWSNSEISAIEKNIAQKIQESQPAQ